MDAEKRGPICDRCIMIVSSEKRHRSIHFATSEQVDFWHQNIVSAQGFWQNRASQYTLLEMLGNGNFGTVTLAEHKFSKVKVALKAIKKTKIQSTFGKQGQSFDELTLMEEVCRGQARNVIQLYESFEDEENYYTVTKHMPHGDLLMYFIGFNKRKPLEEVNVKEIIRQLSYAVSDLHERNILHRDIKLNNILVGFEEDGRLRVRLADMGAAVKFK